MKQATVIVDTNLLVLLVVGTASRTYISKHKRLTEFIPEDFDALCQVLENATSLLVTPNTLTEASNLIRYIGDPARTQAYNVLAQLAQSSHERFIESRTASARTEFVRLGLTDSALLETDEVDTVLLTTDFSLCDTAQRLGRQAINFNHIRDQYL